MGTLVSLRGYAELKGRAPSYAHRLKVSGRLVVVNRDGKELIDVEASDALVEKTGDPSRYLTVEKHAKKREAKKTQLEKKQPVENNISEIEKPIIKEVEAPQPKNTEAKAQDDGEIFVPDNANYIEAKTAHQIILARTARLELEKEKGKYILKEEFERYLFNAGRQLRDSLANCARRVGSEVAGLTTSEECEAIIDREHRTALAGFAHNLRATLKIEVENNPLNAS